MDAFGRSDSNGGPTEPEGSIEWPTGGRVRLETTRRSTGTNPLGEVAPRKILGEPWSLVDRQVGRLSPEVSGRAK